MAIGAFIDIAGRIEAYFIALSSSANSTLEPDVVGWTRVPSAPTTSGSGTVVHALQNVSLAQGATVYAHVYAVDVRKVTAVPITLGALTEPPGSLVGVGCCGWCAPPCCCSFPMIPPPLDQTVGQSSAIAVSAGQTYDKSGPVVVGSMSPILRTDGSGCSSVRGPCVAGPNDKLVLTCPPCVDEESGIGCVLTCLLDVPVCAAVRLVTCVLNRKTLGADWGPRCW